MLTNEEKITQYKELSKRSNELLRSKNYKERNKLCEPIRQLYKEIDWGFNVSENVLVYQGNRKIQARILEITEENTFLISKESGGKIRVPGNFILKMDESEVHSPPVEQQFEQVEETVITSFDLFEQLELQLF